MRRFFFTFIAFTLVFLFEPKLSLAQNAGAWEILPSTPTARTEAAVAILDQKIYVIGGFSPQGVTDLVEIFDVTTGEWFEGAPLPEARHHAAIAVTENTVYIIGGFTSGFWTPASDVFAYDPSSNQWSQKTSMPTPRGALAAGVVDGKVFAIGGANKKTFRLTNTGANEMYDPESDQWTSLTPLPTPRDHLTVSSFNGKIYAIGGRINVDYNQNLDVNEAFNLETNSWSTLPPLPTARSGITSQVLYGNIFVLGGESGEGTFSENEAYNPVTNNWEVMAPMPKGQHGLGSSVHENQLHVLTGGPNPGGGGSKFHAVFKLEP